MHLATKTTISSTHFKDMFIKQENSKKKKRSNEISKLVVRDTSVVMGKGKAAFGKGE